jgi:hypothetical protein
MKTQKICEAPHIVGQLYGVPHRILGVFNTTLYENEFQNPQISIKPSFDGLKKTLQFRSKNHRFPLVQKRTFWVKSGPVLTSGPF